MKELILVATYTFKDLVKRKSFIISNIIILLILIVGFNVPNILKTIQGDDEEFWDTEILLIDNENVFEGSLQAIKDMELGYKIEVADENISIEDVKEKIKNDELDEAIFIKKENNIINIEYIVESMGMTTQTPDGLISILEDTYKNIQISKLNLSEEELNSINTQINIETTQAKEKEASGNIALMLILCLVLFYAIYFYAYQVSSSITTEKTSKIIETLVTSTSPRTIVIGKTIGIGLAGLMQTILLVVVAIICSNVFLDKEMVSQILDVSNITPALAIITIVYYLFGYLLYALLYALTGSTVSKPEDIQSANGPVAILAVIGFYLSYFTMMNPTSNLNYYAAMIPISSPFCMPFRVMMGLTSIQEVLISIAILLVTIFIVAKVSIKIYSSAILNYGSKLNLKEIVKMYKNKE